jgi:hypothetical protein
MLLVAFALFVIIGLVIARHYTPPCNNAYITSVVSLPNSDWNILTVDDACSISTSIVAENKVNHKREELIYFPDMVNVTVAIKNGQIVLATASAKNILQHKDSLDGHRIIFDFTAKNSNPTQ